MNLQVDRREIEQAYRDDPSSAASEYGAQFRSDLESYVSAEAIGNCVDIGVHERPPIDHMRHFGFVDPAGGSGSDSMTLAIAHRQKQDSNIIVLDALREWRPPFNPITDVIGEASELLKSYRITKVYGDRFAGEWCRQPFRDAGVGYEIGVQSKADLYTAFLPQLNSARVRLLDHVRLIGQLASLERTTVRGTGRGVIDHPRGAHDDLSNAVAGVVAVAKRGGYAVDLDWVRGPTDPAAAEKDFQEQRYLNHIRATSGYWHLPFQSLRRVW
jgi:hypothetical protein